ncbi:helix-turn-helix transcriptional regulator [Metallumcola ferriviriculae]|uniref:Helix-turn-helix transcriptional regulator n=1 Tax=Metallumcola ferriviriculae TaxID=3039180 RepID=A0AAU0URF2_9FIRM|nr:helix-turn-helix transcriptional regulator [Desulfitibacteraceae bacterium MK1]
MEIGKRIKSLRKEKKLSLKQLSERTGISISFLSDIENERSTPSLERTKDIAQALNTTVSYLLGEGRGPENSSKLPEQTAGEEIRYLLGKPELKLVLEELKHFEDWDETDRAELFYYLKAKRLIRTKKK